MFPIRRGDLVSPTHRGEDQNGRILDWTKCRARVLEIWITGGSRGEPVANLEWIGSGPFGWTRTNAYPIAMLRRI